MYVYMYKCRNFNVNKRKRKNVCRKSYRGQRNSVLHNTEFLYVHIAITISSNKYVIHQYIMCHKEYGFRSLSIAEILPAYNTYPTRMREINVYQ